MNSFFNISPETEGERGGGGPDDATRNPNIVQSRGFLAIAFGVALGLTFMIFFGLFRIWGAPGVYLTNFVTHINPNLWLSFIYGLIAGTLISALYNFLIYRRMNLFGLDSNSD